jgi:hypothetical protein
MMTTPQFAQAQIAYRQDELKRDYERAAARPRRVQARHAVPAVARRLARATHAA